MDPSNGTILPILNGKGYPDASGKFLTFEKQMINK